MGFVNMKISYGEAASLFALTIWISYTQVFLSVQCELCVKVTTGPDSRMYNQQNVQAAITAL